jgi:hypothetical protein
MERDHVAGAQKRTRCAWTPQNAIAAVFGERSLFPQVSLPTGKIPFRLADLDIACKTPGNFVRYALHAGDTVHAESAIDVYVHRAKGV